MAKIDPYLRPLFDALHDMIDPEKVAAHLERNVIEVAPLAFMRGRTLNDSFVILDEAQNTTPEQMKMFLTRLGFNSKMVITGDITQIDLPRDQRSGLVVVADILEEVEGIEFVRFGGEDVVRHRLVQRIVEAYDEHAERAAPELRPGRQARGRRVLEVEVLGDGPPRRAAAGRDRAPRRHRASRRPRSRTATSRSRSSTPTGSPRSTREHRGKHGPDRRALLPGRRAPARRGRPARAGRHRHLPEHTEDLREAIVHGALHLTGMDHETDDGEMLALQAELLTW